MESSCPGFFWTLNETYGFVHKRNLFRWKGFCKDRSLFFFFFFFFFFLGIGAGGSRGPFWYIFVGKHTHTHTLWQLSSWILCIVKFNFRYSRVWTILIIVKLLIYCWKKKKKTLPKMYWEVNILICLQGCWYLVSCILMHFFRAPCLSEYRIMAVEYVQAVCSFRIRSHYLFYYYIGDYIIHFRQILRSHFVHDCMKKK